MCIYQQENTPYTYRIGWSKTGMNYYGVRYARDCDPSDFWATYFTSSEYVAQYRTIHGEPDIIGVRREFHGDGRVAKAKNIEGRALVRLKAAKRDDYLNKRDGNGQWSDEIVAKHKQATKNAMAKPEIKTKQIRALNEPLTKKKHIDGCIKAQNRPDVKLQNSKSQTLAWQNEDVRKAHADSRLTKKFQDYLATRVGSNAPKFDHTVYRWQHEDGTVIDSNQYDMCKQFKGTRTSCLIKGKRKISLGWRFLGISQV